MRIDERREEEKRRRREEEEEEAAEEDQEQGKEKNLKLKMITPFAKTVALNT